MTKNNLFFPTEKLSSLAMHLIINLNYSQRSRQGSLEMLRQRLG